MKDLIQQLENLLPEHDCVVVPGLGGFVQNEVSARIQPGARLFYPASKEIGFNPRLKFNDGLLAQAYQESLGLSFEQANAAIQTAVQEIQSKLEAGKFIRLGRTGTLFMIEQQLIFRPDHHNHYFPEAYGLTPFTFPLLNAPKVPEATVSTEETTEKKTEQQPKPMPRKGNRDEFIHIRFSRSGARQAIVAGLVFFFLLFFSKPAGVPSGNQEAGMLHNYLSAPKHNVAAIVKDQADLSDKDSSLTEPTTHAAVPTPLVQKDASVAQQPPVVSTNDDAFYIIVSAFVRKSSAQRWMDENQGKDYLKDAGIVIGKGHARVYVKRFKDEAQANQFLGEFVASHPEHGSAWVYSSKND